MLNIRELGSGEVAVLVDLSLSAWEPVFNSLEDVLGDSLFKRLHPDWRADQQRAVEDVCGDGDSVVWVAETNSVIVGFVVLKYDRVSRVGEIYMVAVAPEYQRMGIGRELTDFALAQFSSRGMEVAMVETGGDPGHAPARATYERAGFQVLPVARYFKVL